MYSYNFSEIENEYETHYTSKQKILYDLKIIVLDSNENLEGNSFYHHNSLILFPELHTKQLNLFWCGKQAKTKMCEIGFNAGHSSLLLLLGRDTTPLDFTIFDIGHHSYTRPCLNYIKSMFPVVKFEYIEGDSTTTMPIWINENTQSIGSYDVVHLDGGHSEHCIINDMKHSDILVKVNGIIIIDDSNVSHINDCINRYIESGNYKEIDVLKTQGYPHRIIQKLK